MDERNDNWLKDMQQAYLATADDKIARLSRAVESYLQDPQNSQRSLHRLLHNLIGSGGSYGLPEVSSIAQEMSDLLKRSREHDSTITPSDLSKQLGDLVEHLKAAFGGNR